MATGLDCPEELICFTEEEWIELVDEFNIEVNQPIGDAEAIANFGWEILFLSPWELAYIALPMSVLAFYGLSIYALFKYIQKRYT